jgi:hypothetical protein
MYLSSGLFFQESDMSSVKVLPLDSKAATGGRSKPGVDSSAQLAIVRQPLTDVADQICAKATKPFLHSYLSDLSSECVTSRSEIILRAA